MSSASSKGRETGTRRQAARNLLMLVSLLLFPVTIYYLSPYLPYQGLVEGVLSGSLLVFAFLFLSSTLLGRLFCGWLCPAGAVQHFEAQTVGRAPAKRWVGWIKFGIWIPWAGGVFALGLRAASSRGLRADMLYQTEYGISVARPEAYIVYLVVLLIILILSATMGKRGFCHTACWIAPFMMGGRLLGRLVGLPSLRLRADPASCASCSKCDKECPMGLEVMRQVRESGGIAHRDCILCFRCADGCPRKVIRTSFDAR